MTRLEELILRLRLDSDRQCLAGDLVRGVEGIDVSSSVCSVDLPLGADVICELMVNLSHGPSLLTRRGTAPL